MIDVRCTVDLSIIKSLVVTGHAEFSSNNKIVCAAVSTLVRTLCELVTRYNGVVADCDAPEPGNVMLKIHNVDDMFLDGMSAVTDFFLVGLIAVAKDFPEAIKLKINNKDWYNGTQERWW